LIDHTGELLNSQGIQLAVVPSLPPAASNTPILLDGVGKRLLIAGNIRDDRTLDETQRAQGGPTGLAQEWEESAEYEVGVEFEAARKQVGDGNIPLKPEVTKVHDLAASNRMYVKNLELIQDLARNQERTSVPGGLDRGLREAAVEENAMASQKRAGNKFENKAIEPETTFQFHDFNELPLGGRDKKEVEREFGVKIEILDDRPDELLNAYTIRVSGTDDAVDAFFEMFDSLPNNSKRC
jgi:hypothetical protein